MLLLYYFHFTVDSLSQEPMFTFDQEVVRDLENLKEQGLYKQERVLESGQGVTITVNGRTVINFCANNYLGLASDPDVIAAAQAALQKWGFGLASVRFICGTQTIHLELEQQLSSFLGTENSILYSSCFDANGGLFETLTNEQDAIISDQLNHASIIDGIRLSKAQRFVYRHLDLDDLDRQLAAAKNCRRRIVVTDGVFSMDGDIAPLPTICDLADKHEALVVVDDSHAVGFLGPTGRGTPELHGVQQRVDLVTGTLGKALGGSSGGYISGRSSLIDLLRQRSRPYLFSNSLSPHVVATSLAVLARLENSDNLRRQLMDNTAYFRGRADELGIPIRPGTHPIVPVMLQEAPVAQKIAEHLLQAGIYVISFSFPVVPQGQARIRVQLSAGHSRNQIDQALNGFVTGLRAAGVALQPRASSASA